MKVIIFEEKAFYKLLERIYQRIDKVKSKSIEPQWVNYTEAAKILGIKSKTKMQQLRDDNEIVFSQHGRSIQYSRKSLIAFLEQNSNR